MKSLLKQILSLPLWLKRRKGMRFILTYHDVVEVLKPGVLQYQTSLGAFEAQVDDLNRYFKFVSLDELINSTSDENLMSITFDDGYNSIKNVVFPFLSHRSIPFHVFVNQSAIESNRLWLNVLADILDTNDQLQMNQLMEIQPQLRRENPSNWIPYLVGNFDLKTVNWLESVAVAGDFMNGEDIRKLSEQGVEFGGHSNSHYPLSKLDEKQLDVELKQEKNMLDDLIGRPMKYFAFPFGKKHHYQKSQISYLQDLGYSHCLTTNPNAVKNNSVLLPRISVLNETPSEIRFLLNRTQFKNYDL